MNVKKIPLFFPIFLALIAALFSSTFLPFHLHPFAPLLAFFCYKMRLLPSLWLSSLMGLSIDLLSSQMHFGLHALNYCLSILILYPQRHHFFEDKPFSLPLLTFFFSSLSSMMNWCFLSLTGHPLALSFSFFLIETIVMPLLDGIYAYLWFVLPLSAYLYLRKQSLKNVWNQLCHFLGHKIDLFRN